MEDLKPQNIQVPSTLSINTIGFIESVITNILEDSQYAFSRTTDSDVESTLSKIMGRCEVLKSFISNLNQS